MSSDLALSIRGLSKAYTINHDGLKRPSFREVVVDKIKHPFRKSRQETFWALNDVNFEVAKGEVVGIIGRNGAGKSTLLKVLSRIVEPTKGAVDLYGRVGSLLEVGTGFHPELTGRENIFLNGAILGMERQRIRKQFDAIVAFAEIEKFLDTPVKRYSSGMYVRLAFAVAAHLEPEIMIVDEVLAVGDMEFQNKCLGKMGEVTKSGRTVLFVSHNMAAVKQLCTRGVVLERGRVSVMGSSEECIEAYMAGGVETQRTLKEHVIKCDPDIAIEDVLINGEPWDRVSVRAGQSTLKIVVRGQLRQRKKMDLEGNLLDMHGARLGFFSRGHDTGQTEELPAGPFELRREIRLPGRLNQSTLILGLSLTHHNVAVWADLPDCARISVEGTPTATGRTLSGAQVGTLFLETVPC